MMPVLQGFQIMVARIICYASAPYIMQGDSQVEITGLVETVFHIKPEGIRAAVDHRRYGRSLQDGAPLIESVRIPAVFLTPAPGLSFFRLQVGKGILL